MKKISFLHKGFILLCLALLLAFVNVGRAGAREPASEESVKAAILFNLIRFVEWPVSAGADSSSPRIVATFGQDALQQRMVAMASSAELVSRVSALEVADLDQLKDCRDRIQVLYIARSAHKFIPQILDLLEGRPVLLVGDQEGFVMRGGMMNYVRENNRIRFDINLDKAEKSRLKMSAKLFNLARVIVSDGVARERR
ncbi:MAG: YfiR family protein [Syntrophotaleaceae bacterium]